MFWAFCILGSSKAEATCGDYLAHHMSGTEEISDFPVGTDSAAQHVPLRKPLRLPCHGPSCRRGPVELPLSTPIVSIDLQDHWVWFASLFETTPNQASYLVHSAEPIVLPQNSFRLDRPPKA